jgi:antitoxin (DNA-binding transcriptional repressor) of toxin-antitoxin stability system
MSTISIQDLQQNPAALIDYIASGTRFVGVSEGVPIAEVHPLPPQPQGKRPYGLAKGDFVVPDDFDTPFPEEILREFEGE